MTAQDLLSKLTQGRLAPAEAAKLIAHATTLYYFADAVFDGVSEVQWAALRSIAEAEFKAREAHRRD